MGKKQKGKASVLFECPPLITAAASVVGKKEGEGPLGRYFDQIEADSMLGKKTWEEAESELQTRAARLACSLTERSVMRRPHTRRNSAAKI